MTITTLQAEMLKKMARSEYTELNGAEPDTLNDVGAIWTDCIIESAQDKGVYASLVNAGMVTKSSGGKDAAVGMTQQGFDAYKSYFFTPVAIETTSKTIDQTAVHELALVSINDESFYLSVKSLFPTLFNHYVSGKWDKQKAEKAIYNVVTNWTKENANTYNLGWKPSKAERVAACSEIFDHYEEELTEYIKKGIGPETLNIDIYDYSHDVNGNPTAYHHVMGNARALRRIQIGYSIGLDGCYTAIEKTVGKKAVKFYEVDSTTGSRAVGCTSATFIQTPVNLKG